MNIAVFASGGGSNFQAIIDRINSGDLDVSLSLFVSNSSTCKAMERAKNEEYKTLHISPSHFSSEDEYIEELLYSLKNNSVDLIVLAGYMKKIPSEIIRAYPNKIINIHPALLPAFGGEGMYGMNIHRAVYDKGVKVSGITIHFVNEVYDNGAIIFQKAIDISQLHSPEEIACSVLSVEHDSYWRVIKAMSENRISFQGDRVVGKIE